MIGKPSERVELQATLPETRRERHQERCVADFSLRVLGETGEQLHDARDELQAALLAAGWQALGRAAWRTPESEFLRARRTAPRLTRRAPGEQLHDKRDEPRAAWARLAIQAALLAAGWQALGRSLADSRV